MTTGINIDLVVDSDSYVGEGGEKHDEELFCAVEAMLG